MVSMVLSSLAAHSSSLYRLFLDFSAKASAKQTYSGFSLQSSRPISKRVLRSVCFFKAGDDKSKPDIQDKVTLLNSAATHYNESLLLAFFGLSI